MALRQPSNVLGFCSQWKVWGYNFRAVRLQSLDPCAVVGAGGDFVELILAVYGARLPLRFPPETYAPEPPVSSLLAGALLRTPKPLLLLVSHLFIRGAELCSAHFVSRVSV